MNAAGEPSERTATAASALSDASSLGRSEDGAQLLDIVRWLSFVEHRVAVGANRHQVLDRVQPVALPKRGERSFVVNVDEAFADLAVSLLKINIAHGAPCPVMANACEAGSAVALVPVHTNAFDGALRVGIANKISRERRITNPIRWKR